VDDRFNADQHTEGSVFASEETGIGSGQSNKQVCRLSASTSVTISR
jgi:hypothetical protein